MCRNAENRCICRPKIQIYTNIFKFQTGVLCYNKEITQIGNIIFISQNQTHYIFIQQNLHENDYSVLL